MPLRSGRDYIDGLAKNPPEVWISGRRVGDVTTDPVFRRPIAAIAKLYDLQARDGTARS